MEQLVFYVEQIGSALDYAHHRGVVHLDLKPQNLLVHEDGRLLLSDFGLAHLLKQESLEGGTSLRYGTPHYMAPEHINGQPDKRSDVYALGIMLYQMLVGQRPFEGLTPEAVMVKHLTEPPLPLQALRPELPLELEGVLERALAKRVEQRYQSADELVVALKDALVRARERARKAEEKWAQKAREEQARKAEEARLRRVEEEHARKAEKPPPTLKKPRRSPIIIGVPLAIALLLFVSAGLFYLTRTYAVSQSQPTPSVRFVPVTPTSIPTQQSTPEQHPKVGPNYTATDIMNDFIQVGVNPINTSYEATISNWSGGAF